MDYLVPVDTCQIPGLQQMYYAAFGDRRDGSFVEVGAYDGITYSNTYHLAVGGWSGVYVEPVEKLYEKCIGNHKNHPGVLVLMELVGDPSSSPQELWFDGVELYSTKKWLVDELSATGKTEHFGTIQPISLDYVLELCKVSRHFELLVIDVEGAELDVLNGFSLYYWLPQMVIIETHELHHNTKLGCNAPRINDLMAGALYTKIHTDIWNSVYIR